MTSLAAVGNLLEFAPYIVQWILKALLLGTCAAALTWILVRTVLRSARPTILTAFWLVVLLRFVVPELPAIPVSLSNLLRLAPWAQPTASITAAPLPAVPQFSSGQFDFYYLLEPSANTGVASTEPPVVMRAQKNVLLSLAMPIVLLYALAVSALAVCRIRAYRRFARASRGYPLADVHTQRLVREICTLSGVRCAPHVHVQSTDCNAFVFGLLRPTLVLSHRHLASRDELRAVVLHEIAHLRRGDLLVRHVQWIVGTLLFFWPVVAWVNRRIDLAREHACDEWALRHSALSATQYARCLLRAASGVTLRCAPFTPAAMASNLNHVERRIEMIFQSSSRMRTSRWLGMTSGMALLAWGGFILSGANATMSAKATAPEQTARGHAVSILTEDGVPATCEKRIIVRNVGSSANAVAWVAGEPGGQLDDHTVVMARCDASPDGTEIRKCVVKISREIDANTLASFREAHPSADANGDGQLTTAEHNAYLAALALRDGAAVLAQFPKADLNSNGQLDVDEAVRLATIGLPFEMKCDAAFGDLPNVIRLGAIAETDAEGNHVAIVPSITIANGSDSEVKIGATEDGANGQIRVIARHIDPNNPVTVGTAIELNLNGDTMVIPRKTEDAETTAQNGKHQIVIRKTVRLQDVDGNVVVGTGDGLIPPLMADFTPNFHDMLATGGPGMVVEWLVQNIRVQPTEEEVAALIEHVERLPFDLFLKSHPDADTDRDGVLTPEERDAYLQNLIGEIRVNGEINLSDATRGGAKPRIALRNGDGVIPPQGFLKAFPQADTDGDGNLSQEEFNTHILTLIENQGHIDADQPNRRVFLFQNGGMMIRGSKLENGDQREAEIRVEHIERSPKE